ncbi:MAG: SpoIIE family protein phosphatase [Alphaproteobacteria bacterium]|nr:SpoIIE family protein phosphatase [Alphaproteobacteria bacterium]
MIYLTGDKVPSKSVYRIAEQAHIKAWPGAGEPLFKNGLQQRFPKNLVVLAGRLTEDKLTEHFFMPISALVDIKSKDESILSFIKKMGKIELPNSLSFLLTCPVIYSTNIAEIFTRALNRRLHFSKSQFEGIHFALHESIVNGLIHGNLHVNSSMRQSARDFVEYARLLHNRLEDPEYAHKSISIIASWDKKKLEVKIRDEGVGYEKMTPVAKEKSSAKSGRGLRIIAGTADSCTIDDFGREITLSFLLEDSQASRWLEHYADANQDPSGGDNSVSPDLSGCSVLVVEDNLSNQTVLSRLLNVMGITKIEVAGDGVEGLKKIETFIPDLIILDIAMPRMNGYEVLHQLKVDSKTRNIPVLIQTAVDSRETREKTFSSGATDFITKPVNPLEFFARVRVHLENHLLIQHLESQLAQIEEELLAAQKMQVGLLPTRERLDKALSKYKLDMAQYFFPSSVLGGDFWQMFPISDTQLGIYICDFSGHGVAAALNTFRLHALISQLNKDDLNPAHFLKTLNTQLNDLLPRGQFATLFMGVWDKTKRTLTYSGAGAPNPLVIARGRETLLHTDGMPLGISPKPTYKNYKIKLQDGDGLLLYSDALTETPNPERKRLGEDGFKKMALPCLKKADANMAIKELMNAFFKFAPNPPDDDITAVLIKVKK